MEFLTYISMEGYLNEKPKKISREDLKNILRERNERIEQQRRQMFSDAQVARMADLRELETKLMAAIEEMGNRLRSN